MSLPEARALTIGERAAFEYHLDKIRKAQAK